MFKRMEFDGSFVGNAKPLWFEFCSEDGVLRDGQFGMGSVEYAEGSVYTGTLIYSHGRYNKFGYGTQDFTRSTVNAAAVGAPKGMELYCFAGRYDYTVSDWIYGNGVMYFTAGGKPAAYAKGFYVGPTRTGRWKGKFTKDLLLPGYKKTREIQLFPRREQFYAMSAKAEQAGEAKNVLIGDSWFEFYERGVPGCDTGTFAEDSAGKSVLNLGIGGTTYADWSDKVALAFGTLKFENVFINLGFNDLHGGRTVSEVYKNFLTVVAGIRKLNPRAHIYVNAVCPCVSHPEMLKKKFALNEKIERFCASDGNATFVPCDIPFFRNGRVYLDGLNTLDGIHLTFAGYKLWAPCFTKYW